MTKSGLWFGFQLEADVLVLFPMQARARCGVLHQHPSPKLLALSFMRWRGEAEGLPVGVSSTLLPLPQCFKGEAPLASSGTCHPKTLEYMTQIE